MESPHDGLLRRGRPGPDTSSLGLLKRQFVERNQAARRRIRQRPRHVGVPLSARVIGTVNPPLDAIHEEWS